MKRTLVGALGLAAFCLTWAGVAAAQFDAQHDHLKCYKITGGAILTKVQTDNQFGREMIVKLVPQFLCAPTQKTCLATDGSCGKPGAPSGTPVQHFKCYKVAAKQCPNNDCTTLTGHFTPVPATLIDQFGQESVTVGVPKMLCAPVEKIVSGATTTTTTTPVQTTTTTTGPPCVTGGCTVCGSCGDGECHKSGGGGGCGAPGTAPVCVSKSTCVAVTSCSTSADCPNPATQVCVFCGGGAGCTTGSECCAPCP